MNQKVKSVETNKTEGLTLPYMLVWPLRKGDGEATDIAVFIPPSEPIVWTLKRVLEGFLLSGRELFFGLSSKKNSQEIAFYRWPLARRLLTNDQGALKEVLYDLGEFELAEKVELSTLRGMFNLLLPISLEGKGMGKVSVSLNGLWDKIFEVGDIFDDFSIYWIEDRKEPLVETGLFVKFSEQGMNLCKFQRTKAIKCIPLKNTEELRKKIDWERRFNMFIVDMYFDGESGRTIRILGDDIIELIRAEEKKQGWLYHNLVIVYTAGSSPFIVSKAKALTADLVVFKGSARGHQGSFLEGRFHLFWGIYWPLSVLKFIHDRLKGIKDKEELNKKDFSQLYREINKLCPQNVFFFWEDWINAVKESLRNWEMILTNHPQNGKSKVFIDEVRGKVDRLLKGKR